MKKPIIYPGDLPESPFSRIWAPLLLVGGILWFFLPLFWNPGPHLTMDQPMWTAFAHVLAQEILPEQKWFWGILTGRENAGLVMGHSYSLNLIILWFLHFFVTPEVAVKTFLVVCILCFCLGFFMILKKFMHPLFAVISVLFIFPEFLPNAVQGMCYSHLSVGCALFFWVTALRFLNHFRPSFWALAVFLFTVTLYAHPMGAITAFVIWASILISYLLRRGEENRLKIATSFFLIPWIALLLAGPQLWAMVSAQVEIPGEPSVSQMIRNLPPLHWETWFQKMVKIQVTVIARLSDFWFFGLIGLVVLWKKKDTLRWPAWGIYLAGLFLTAQTFLLFPDDLTLPLKLVHYSYRFFLYLQIFAFLIIGIGFDSLRTSTKKIESFLPTLKKEAMVFRFLIFLVAIGLCFFPLRNLYKDRESFLVTLETFEGKDELQSLWKWINQNVNPRETRVYFEDTFGTYPWGKMNNRNHPLALTSIYTGIRQVGGWCGFTSHFAYHYNIGIGGYLFGYRESFQLTEAITAESLRLLNCRFLIAHSPEIKEFLDRVSFLEKIETIGVFHIYEYPNGHLSWAYNKKCGERFELERINSIRYNLSGTGQAGEPILVSLSYNPYWQARQGNTPIPIRHHKALMQIDLPTTGAQVIELEYRIPKRTPLLLFGSGMIFLLMGALGILLLSRPRIRKM